MISNITIIIIHVECTFYRDWLYDSLQVGNFYIVGGNRILYLLWQQQEHPLLKYIVVSYVKKTFLGWCLLIWRWIIFIWSIPGKNTYDVVVTGQMLPPQLVTTTKNKKKCCQFEYDEFISLSLYTHKYIYNYQKYVVCAQLPGNDTCRWQRDNMSCCHQNQIPYFVVEIQYYFFLDFGGSYVCCSYSCVTPIIIKLDRFLILEEQYHKRWHIFQWTIHL